MTQLTIDFKLVFKAFKSIFTFSKQELYVFKFLLFNDLTQDNCSP